MNSDNKQSRSKHSAQRLNPKPSGTAAQGTSTKQPPVGDIFTYQDSRGHAIEDDDEDYDDRPIGQMPRSSLRRSSFADVQTEEQPPRGNLALTPQQQTQQLPEGVRWIRGIPCLYINGYWRRVELHEGTLDDIYPPPKHYPHRDTEALAKASPASRRPRLRFHPLFFVGMAMIFMIVGYVVLTMFGDWVVLKIDDLKYGRPRTFQTDAVVGHGDSPQNPSHFQCINLDRKIQIIEEPGGDESKAKIYLGPTLIGPGEDLTPCIITFEDVTGKGKVDMVLSIGGTVFVMINDNGGFRPVKPGEHIKVQQGG